jgi:transposase-like protein
MACLQQMTALQLAASFPDDNACKAYLAKHRWPDKVHCPRCGNVEVYGLPAFNWQCQACNRNGYRFSVLVGTIFENTKISLKVWFRTIHIMLTKKGVAIVEVQRTMGLGSYRSAWFLCHRIRTALTDDNFRKLMGIVEVNEDGENTVSPSKLSAEGAR